MKNRNDLLLSFEKKTGQIAILIDPEKAQDEKELIEKLKKADFAKVDYFFVGGSTVTPKEMQFTLSVIKANSNTPTIIFPGDYQQVDSNADGLLYLSLLSGRNAEYLIGQHVVSARQLYQIESLEVIPTAYILIDGGKNSSVAYVSQTSPIPREKTSIAINTALAGILQGKRVVYFDAGSGAKEHVPVRLIKEFREVDQKTTVIVGGDRKSVV